MCPACLSTVALVAAGAGSTSGVTALLVQKLRARLPAKDAGSKPLAAARPENHEPETHAKENPR